MSDDDFKAFFAEAESLRARFVFVLINVSKSKHAVPGIQPKNLSSRARLRTWRGFPRVYFELRVIVVSTCVLRFHAASPDAQSLEIILKGSIESSFIVGTARIWWIINVMVCPLIGIPPSLPNFAPLFFLVGAMNGLFVDHLLLTIRRVSPHPPPFCSSVNWID